MEELKNIVSEYSRQSDYSKNKVFEQASLLKECSKNPLAHYDILQRKYKKPIVEKLDDYIL